MSFPKQHEIHKRRFSRNAGLGLVLAAFVVLVFGLSLVKVTRGDFSEPAASEGASSNGY